jgi:N-acetylglucosamine-6-sulfatase
VRSREALGGGAALALAAGAAALALSTGGGAGADRERKAPSGRPNLVIVLADDMDVRAMRVMDATRRLIGRRGVTFANAYVTTPQCCPSRASLLTGRYAHNHGVVANEPPAGGFEVFHRTVQPRLTLPARLDRAGYETGLVGKYLNHYNRPDVVPAGWDRWFALEDSTQYRMFGYEVSVDGRLRRFESAARDYQTDVLARFASRFVAHGDPPFFLLLAPVPPHADPDLPDDAARNPIPAPRHRGRFGSVPLPRPPSFNEHDLADKPLAMRRPRLGRRDIRRLTTSYRSRLESLLAVDEAVAGLVAALRRAGELKETVVAFTSDNGLMLGEHRQTGKGLAYQESARVPLLIRGPGFPEGARRSAAVANIDLAPTFLRLAHAGGVRAADGIPLGRIARGGGSAQRPLLINQAPAGGRPYAAVRSGRWLYVDHRGAGRELYDLAADPHQLESLVGVREHADARRRLAADLRDLRGCRAAGCR